MGASSGTRTGSPADAERLAPLIAAQRPGHALSREFYCDAALFEYEMQRLMLRHWHCAGHASQAADPGDFFTVDVRFVAARNMLRGLAFRLRDGAEGVVLVKPQFELADRQVRGGRVDDANLRRTALDKVTMKAEALGFAVVAHDDSPVAGGSGTVEILAHLRFLGRPESLPAPGERRGSWPPAFRRGKPGGSLQPTTRTSPPAGRTGPPSAPRQAGTQTGNGVSLTGVPKLRLGVAQSAGRRLPLASS